MPPTTSLAWALAAMVTGLSGCVAGGDPALREAWREEAAEHGPLGTPAQLSMVGGAATLEGLVAYGKGLTLAPAAGFPSDHRFVFVPNATVQGLGQGLVVLEGDAIHLAAADAMRFPIGTLDLAEGKAGLVERAGMLLQVPGPYPADWVEADRADFFTAGASFTMQEATVTGFDRGLLLQANGSHGLSHGIRVSAGSLHMADRSLVHASALDLEGDRFAMFFTGANASAVVDGVMHQAFAAAGLQASLRYTAGLLSTVAPLRATQVLTPSGFLFPAVVEVWTDIERISVKNGSSYAFEVDVRERGYAGDAVLARVQLSGSAAPATAVPLAFPNVILRGLAGDPRQEVAQAAIAPEVLSPPKRDCWFVCYETYPTWLPAGGVASFTVVVQGDLAPGVYDLVLEIEGANHEAVTLQIAVVVEPGP